MPKTKHAQKIIFFNCYTCKDYELKTNPHYRSQKALSLDGVNSEKRTPKAKNDSPNRLTFVAVNRRNTITTKPDRINATKSRKT